SRRTVADRLEALAKGPVQYNLPPVESQLNAVAVRPAPPVPPPEPTNGRSRANQQERKRIALLSKIASLIGQANAYLAREEYDKALEEITRANLLDPENKEIHQLERKIRKAKEEAHQRDQERLRIVREEEEAERVRRLEEERERVRREEEETRSRREEARKIAQQQKMTLCLRRSREFLEAGLLAEAQSELAFALVIDPGNRDAAKIEKEIARKHEEIRQAAIERKRKEEEERKREEERVQATIRSAIVSAEKASSEADFAEALRIVTRAYVLDPGNKDLMSAESGILAARDEWAQKQQEERRAAEEEVRRKREEELRRKEEEERERLLAERLAESRTKQKEDEAQIAMHLNKARSLTEEDNYDQALAEVALAFVINPFSEQVKEVEREVLLAQGDARARRAEEPEPVSDPVAETLPEITPEPFDEPATDPEDESASEPPPEESPPRSRPRKRLRPKDEPTPEDDVSKMLVSHLEKANVYSSRGDYAQAFEQIARAYALSPLDRRIAECESSIQARFVEYQESEESPQGAGEEMQLDSNRGSGESSAPGPTVPAKHTRAGTPDVRPAGKRSGRKRRSRTPRRLAAATVASLVIILLSGLYLTSPGNKGQSSNVSTSQQPADLVQEPPQKPELASLTRDILPEDELPSLREEIAQDVELASLTPPGATIPRYNNSGTGKTPDSRPEPRREIQSVDRGNLFDDSQIPTGGVPAGEAGGMPNSTAGKPQVPVNLDPLATVRPPEIIRLQRPSFSDIALKSEIEEEVSVMVEIGADGQPLQAKIVESTNPLYNHAVIDAVMKSVYRPGQSHAGPITMWMTIPFQFKP
ncbi:MAG: energy transducer TonB, partial [Bacteroidota bacterium]